MYDSKWNLGYIRRRALQMPGGILQTGVRMCRVEDQERDERQLKYSIARAFDC